MKIEIDIKMPTPEGPLTPKQGWKLAWQLMRQKPEGQPAYDWVVGLTAFVNPDFLDHSYLRAADFAYFERTMERFTGDYIFHLIAIQKQCGDAQFAEYRARYRDFLRRCLEREVR